MTLRRRWASLALLTAVACGPSPPGETGGSRLPELREAHGKLHERLEKAMAKDALAGRVFGDSGRVIIAIRSRLIEDLMIKVARQYLDRVAIDLAALESQAHGRIRHHTFLGQVKLGDWRLEMVVDRLTGRLEAGTPRLRFRGENVLAVHLPVEVKAAPGRIAIRFVWDSSSVVSLLCRDFEISSQLEGRVLPQSHLLRGAVQFAATDDFVTVAPLFPDRTIHLKIDLTPESWTKVEAALRSQDTLGRCGILLKPEEVLERLRELAAGGIKVTLPESIFRTVRLPAGLERAVHIDERVIDLSVKTGTLRVTSDMLWSSASVRLKDRNPNSPP
jgi:hypothetical protein